MGAAAQFASSVTDGCSGPIPVRELPRYVAHGIAPASVGSGIAALHGNGPSHCRSVAFGAEFGVSFSQGANQPPQPSRYASTPARFDLTANDGRTYFGHKAA